ncbi:MAG: ATP synthase F1 subunit epsilon [Acidimicrobiales bacterium]
MPLQVELVSPERILHSGEAEMVVCRTSDGEIAFLSGHAPFLGALGIGVVRIHQVGGGTVRAAVHGGFVQVREDRVIILSDVAELPGQVDAERARRAADEAERAVGQAGGDADVVAEADARLRRARTRLELVDR